MPPIIPIPTITPKVNVPTINIPTEIDDVVLPEIDLSNLVTATPIQSTTETSQKEMDISDHHEAIQSALSAATAIVIPNSEENDDARAEQLIRDRDEMITSLTPIIDVVESIESTLFVEPTSVEAIIPVVETMGAINTILDTIQEITPVEVLVPVVKEGIDTHAMIDHISTISEVPVIESITNDDVVSTTTLPVVEATPLIAQDVASSPLLLEDPFFTSKSSPTIAIESQTTTINLDDMLKNFPSSPALVTPLDTHNFVSTSSVASLRTSWGFKKIVAVVGGWLGIAVLSLAGYMVIQTMYPVETSQLNANLLGTSETPFVQETGTVDLASWTSQTLTSDSSEATWAASTADDILPNNVIEIEQPAKDLLGDVANTGSNNSNPSEQLQLITTIKEKLEVVKWVYGDAKEFNTPKALKIAVVALKKYQQLLIDVENNNYTAKSDITDAIVSYQWLIDRAKTALQQD